MKVFKISILLLSVMLILSACSSEADKSDANNDGDTQMAATKDAASANTATVGKMAPEFSLTSLKGKKVSLSDFSGKFVILEWINFDCPFVQKHYSSGNMQELQKKYRGEGAVWISICSSSPGKQGHFEGDALKQRIHEERWNGDYYLNDSDGTVGKMYAAKTTPSMYIIDPKGEVIYAGAIDDTPSTSPDDIPKSENYVVAAMTSAISGEFIKTSYTKSYGCSVKY